MGKSNSLVKLWDQPINGRQIYFVAFLCYFLPTFLSETTFSMTIDNHWLRILSYVSLPLLLFKIYVLDHWRKKELFIISIAMIIGLIVWRKASYPDLLVLAPFMIGAKNVNFRDIVRWYFYLTVILMGTLVAFSLIRIIPNLIYHSELRPTRYSLGMLYPSVIAAHYLYLVLAYSYLKFGRLHISDYLLFILGDYVCMRLTDTKLDFIATLIVIPIIIITQRAFFRKPLSSKIASFWWMATPISATVMIFLSYFYTSSNHLLRKANSLLSDRLSLGHEAFEKYRVNLFGRTIVEHSFAGAEGHKFASSGLQNHYFYIDSSYIRMILLWGLVAFLIVICCLTFIAIRSTIHKTYIVSAVLLIASLSFMFEPHIIQIIYNPFILALFSNSYYSKLNKEIKNAK